MRSQKPSSDTTVGWCSCRTISVSSTRVADKIWVCENKTVRDWKTDIRMYKKHLSDKADREARERKAKVRK